jgi:hypothetical protein
MESAFEIDEGIVDPVPKEQYQKLLDTYYEQQLFLDSDCLVAVELAIGALQASLPFEDGDRTKHARDCDLAFRRLEYILPRVASVFQEKLGLLASTRAKLELATLGAVLLLNQYHFREIALPVMGNLKIQANDWPADIVARGEANREELLRRLDEFGCYLREGQGIFHEAATDITRYTAMLGIQTKEGAVGV